MTRKICTKDYHDKGIYSEYLQRKEVSHAKTTKTFFSDNAIANVSWIDHGPQLNKWISNDREGPTSRIRSNHKENSGIKSLHWYMRAPRTHVREKEGKHISISIILYPFIFPHWTPPPLPFGFTMPTLIEIDHFAIGMSFYEFIPISPTDPPLIFFQFGDSSSCAFVISSTHSTKEPRHSSFRHNYRRQPHSTKQK